MTPVSTNDQGQFSVNGQRADANYFTVDGASANFGVTGALTLGQVVGGALPVLECTRRHKQPRLRGGDARSSG